MSIAVGGVVGAKLCAVLGIEAQYVVRIVLTVDPENAVIAVVTRYLSEDEAQQIVEALGHYRLQAVEEGAPA